MENMPEFTLHRPQTAAEAVALKAEDETSRYLAGGTDMIVNVRRGIEAPETMIDLTAIADIASITKDGDGIRVGAGVKLAELATDETIRRDYPAIAQAANGVTSYDVSAWSCRFINNGYDGCIPTLAELAATPSSGTPSSGTPSSGTSRTRSRVIVALSLILATAGATLA